MPKHAVIEVRQPEVGSRFIVVWFSREIANAPVKDVADTLSIAGRMTDHGSVGGGIEYFIMPPEENAAALISGCEALRLGIQHHLGFQAHIVKTSVTH